VEELKSPGYHPEFVKEAIYLALEKSPPCVEPVVKLLEHLYSKKVLAKEDLRTGCVLYGSLLDDIGIDLPKAPNNFGEILGMLVIGGELDFKVVEEVLKKIEDGFFKKAVFPAVMKIVSSSPSGQVVLDTQAADIAACQTLL
jgi:translation initiation factor 4G